MPVSSTVKARWTAPALHTKMSMRKLIIKRMVTWACNFLSPQLWGFWLLHILPSTFISVVIVWLSQWYIPFWFWFPILLMRFSIISYVHSSFMYFLWRLCLVKSFNHFLIGLFAFLLTYEFLMYSKYCWHHIWDGLD